MCKADIITYNDLSFCISECDSKRVYVLITKYAYIFYLGTMADNSRSFLIGCWVKTLFVHVKHLTEWPVLKFSFQPVLHDWCNKSRDMCYPVCAVMHIKEPLLLIENSSLCGGRGLSEWSFTICPTPYNRK